MENFPGFKKITEITLQRHWKSGRRILFALNVSNLLFLFLVFICLHNKKDKIYYMEVQKKIWILMTSDSE